MCSLPLAARPVAPARVLALHCSGSSGTQWRHLKSTLGSKYDLVTPDLLRLDDINSQLVNESLTLEHEVDRFLRMIDHANGAVHLVGHSYGGAVALRLALKRSDHIASLILYEPSAFSLLREMGEYGRLAAQEIQVLATRVRGLVRNGFSQAAAEQFARYWGGHSAWAKLRPDQQQELTQQMPLVVQHFHALQDNAMRITDLRDLSMPTLILRGSLSPTPARMISCHLLAHLPEAKGACFSEAGHMGPFTHADQVAHRIARFIDACDDDSRRAGTQATGDVAA